MRRPEILLCLDPEDPDTVDCDWGRESSAALEARLPRSLMDFEALVDDGRIERAVRQVERTGAPRMGIYRGWMLGAPVYSALYAALARRGLILVNSPDQYVHCHHLPENYPLIAGRTARTVWLPGDPDHGAVMVALAAFGGPVVLKDYVKSQKHFWDEACFIPDPSDSEAVRRVVGRFRELQDGIQGGLVFREFLDLEPMGSHQGSGMPLSLEFRAFVLDGKPFFVFPYWEADGYPPDLEPPLGEFAETIRSIRSRFFTVDLARTRAGQWVIVELGDGQVAGLPKDLSERFYRALAAALGA